MRICFVAFQFWPSVGGSQTQVEKQARYLCKSGEEVLVITLRHQRAWRAREKYQAFPVVRVGGLYKRDGTLRAGKLGHLLIDILVFFTLWRLRRSYDLIHTLQMSPLAAVAALIGKLTHKPVIVGVQSTGPCECASELALPVVQALAVHESTAKLEPPVVASPQEIGGDIAWMQQTVWGGRRMLDYLRKSDAYYQILSSRSYIYLMHHGFRPERIVYIPNGVDTQQFYPALSNRESSLPGERIVLCVARLEYAKGVDVLLQAWARMMALPDSWRADLLPRLSLVGDGSCRAELEQLVLDLDIQDSVEFLGTRHDIALLMQRARVFVLPSRWEGMPNALLEAMASGLPCIATQVSGSEDIIEQGLNGLLVQPEQPENLAYALRLMIEDTSLARQLGWRGYETVLRYYQLHSTAQSCLAFYRYLLNKSRDRSSQTLLGYAQQSNIYPEEWQRYE